MVNIYWQGISAKLAWKNMNIYTSQSSSWMTFNLESLWVEVQEQMYTFCCQKAESDSYTILSYITGVIQFLKWLRVEYALNYSTGILLLCFKIPYCSEHVLGAVNVHLIVKTTSGSGLQCFHVKWTKGRRIIIKSSSQEHNEVRLNKWLNDF